MDENGHLGNGVVVLALHHKSDTKMAASVIGVDIKVPLALVIYIYPYWSWLKNTLAVRYIVESSLALFESSMYKVSTYQRYHAGCCRCRGY